MEEEYRELHEQFDEAMEEVKRAREIAYEAPELNMNNFSIDDAEKLNDYMIKLFNILDDFIT